MAMPLKALVIPVTPFQQNTSLIWCDATMEAAFVDPGGEVDKLAAAVDKTGVRVSKILLTHGHLDHAGAATDLAARYGVAIEGPHRDEDWLLSSIAAQGAKYGWADGKDCTPDRWLEDGDTVSVGAVTMQVLHCPGHTPGHVVFFDPAARFAFVGDVIFKGSIGRSDFPRGNFDDLVGAIRTKLFPLGDDVRFLPGHGDLSTFGWERRTNPFVSDLAVGAA
jgi:glyoxylase-like metal-dependent hydrolase (beta-lactamase superfamily II)